MSEIKRYSEEGTPNFEDPDDGDFVKFDDYARLEAECAALKVDAERYRFLKSGYYNMRLWDEIGEISGNSWDDLIDDAMQAGDKP